MVLLKQFDYLSDGRDTLVEDLGVVLFLKFLDYFPRAGIENQGEIAKNGYNVCVLKVFCHQECF